MINLKKLVRKSISALTTFKTSTPVPCFHLVFEIYWILSPPRVENKIHSPTCGGEKWSVPTMCDNTHHDATTFEFDGMVSNIKNSIS